MKVKAFSMKRASILIAALTLAIPSAHAATITTVSIEDFSSELTSFGRQAVNCINGSGFDELTGFHATTSTNVEWATTGQLFGGDMLPAHITFDLGMNYDLNSLKVWNLNEPGFTGRGANSVNISVASTDIAPTFTLVDNFTFTQAPGSAIVDFGQTIDLSGYTETLNVRLIRFDIITHHNGGSEEITGLSEVRFDGVLVPEPSTALLGGLGLLALLRRRR